MVGLWVMEVLVIPMLGSDLYDEGLMSYGFATHVWETGGRDFVRIEMVGRVACSSVEVSVGDGRRMWGVICIARGWCAMMETSMKSGSVWSGWKEVDDEMSCVVR